VARKWVQREIEGEQVAAAEADARFVAERPRSQYYVEKGRCLRSAEAETMCMM
jgi:hypothetical protein